MGGLAILWLLCFVAKVRMDLQVLEDTVDFCQGMWFC